ncbi:MAG: RCC1 domain-containing protein [Gammaproteobacteria bacterium]
MQISTGGNRLGKGHSCGVRNDGSIQCWGWNGFGQATPPEGEFTKVNASSYTTCGIRPNGLVECWGYDGDGLGVVPDGLLGNPNQFQPPVIDYEHSRLLNISTNGFSTLDGMTAGFIVLGGSQRFVLMGENLQGMRNPILKLLITTQKA